MKRGIHLVFCLFLGFFWIFTKADNTIDQLIDVIAKSQQTTDQEFKYFPLSWEKLKGMYHNDVKLNFHGDEQLSIVRERFSVPDNNMFTPAWVSSCLLEANVYGKAKKPATEQILLSLAAINQYRSKDTPYSNSLMTFWHQKWNESAKFYQSTPTNLFAVLDMPNYLPNDLIEEVLKLIGLGELEEVYKKLIHEKNAFQASFHIPADFDDTFVNLGLGALMYQFQHDFPTEAKTWLSQNSNLTSIFDSLKKYAYRPFSGNQRVNTIDPRTYFYLRDFLENVHTSEDDVALVTTWVQDTDEVRTLFDKGVAMPFNINNVDITVASNFIYGVVTGVGSGLLHYNHVLLDDNVQQIFLNTTSLVVHEIMNNISSRPDLALTYYPSKFEFYWFVTRSYAWLNRFFIPSSLRGSYTPSVQQLLMTAYHQLRPAVRGALTRDIMTAAKQHGSDKMYVDNFLGDGDVDFFNRPLVRGEDRIFSTAVSTCALINVWTSWTNGTLKWETDTPDNVKSAVTQMVKWLKEFSLTETYKPWSTFFSGSGKGEKSMPFFYPANRLEYFNGTKFSDDKFPDTFKNIIGLEGFVSRDQYKTMLRKPHFGKMTPMDFDGYNTGETQYFPFWSSEPYTYATVVVALAHYDNIHE